ncbi:platelet glycoprotein VI [Talpa occidentalis]|uniref:platelet glycoprotein VI n=1 Tax=Talpa occidentalis TaxID=50954 RepID=UPI00188ECC34|nr:platelet glycoprotein VI [Talpa occidentalis]
MSPSLPALLCLGLCLGPATAVPEGALPKPSLQALPSPLVPLGQPVTLRCQGPPGAALYRLEKLRSSTYKDQAVLAVAAMTQEAAGRYRCSYQDGSRWSPPSDQLELVATGVYGKPVLSAKPSPAVSPGGDVTLQCHSQYGFDRFALYKEGDPRAAQKPEKWYWADFPLVTVTAAHSGTYRCYSFSSASPYLWSAPSDPLRLVVTVTDVPTVRMPTDSPASVPELPEASRKPNMSVTSRASATESSRSVLVAPKGSVAPTGPSRLRYTQGNLVRMGLGAALLVLLAALLAEDWYSRRTLPARARAVHRPLPPLPQPQKSPRRQDGGPRGGHP